MWPSIGLCWSQLLPPPFLLLPGNDFTPPPPTPPHRRAGLCDPGTAARLISPTVLPTTLGGGAVSQLHSRMKKRRPARMNGLPTAICHCYSMPGTKAWKMRLWDELGCRSPLILGTDVHQYAACQRVPFSCAPIYARGTLSPSSTPSNRPPVTPGADVACCHSWFSWSGGRCRQSPTLFVMRIFFTFKF